MQVVFSKLRDPSRAGLVPGILSLI